MTRPISEPRIGQASRALSAPRLDSLRGVALAAAILAVVALLLTGCGAPAPAPTAAPAPVSQPTAAAVAPTAQPAAPTQAPTVAAAPTQAPTAAAAPTQAPAAPTQAPTAAPAPTQAPTATSAPAPQASVSFSKDVLPIFEKSCIQCHGGERTEEGLSLKTVADVLKGSTGGAVIKPGNAADSLLVQQIVSGKMPKRAAKLPQNQIDIVAAWVNAGAPNN